MKTTKVRKLLPDSWGFVCPVHTPDGGLCGLLCHLSIGCRIQAERIETNDPNHVQLTRILSSLGMLSCNQSFPPTIPGNCIHVIFNGKVIGFVDPNIAQEFTDKLREIKVKQINSEIIHSHTSITYIPPSPFPKAMQFSAIYIYTEAGRPLRQVIN